MLYLTRIGHTFYFRARIPKDLRGYFHSQVLKKSLKTKNLKNAHTLVRALGSKAEKLFTLMRSSMYSYEELKALAYEDFDLILRECEESRALKRRADPENLSEEIETKVLVLNEYREELALNDTRRVQSSVDDFIQERHLDILKGAPEYQTLCREWLKASIEIGEIEIERMRGNYDNGYDKLRFSSIPRPTPPINLPLEPKGKRLSDVVDLYIKEKSAKESWRPKTKDENESVFKLLISIIGNVDVKTLERGTLIDYSITLSKLPSNMNKKKQFSHKTIPEVLKIIETKPAPVLSERTRTKNLERVSSLFKWCVEFGYMDKNPASGLSVKESAKANQQRDVFGPEDLERLFNSPIYTTEIPLKQPERYWIPLIALHSGMRLNEICQLYVDDILEVDGIPCISVNNRADKKSKTDASDRVFPIHPMLIELGFLDYVAKLRLKGRKRLWENLKKGRDGYGDAFGKWFQRYNRKHVTEDRKKVFHSFRHNLQDSLKQKEVLGTIIGAIVGHKDNTETTGRYGKDYKPAVLLGALKKTDYPIDFGHLIKQQHLWK